MLDRSICDVHPRRMYLLRSLGSRSSCFPQVQRRGERPSGFYVIDSCCPVVLSSVVLPLAVGFALNMLLAAGAVSTETGSGGVE